jgi:HD-GYP domain-containing protein (c-di-GMP phosphodiesterase class II)
MKQTELVDATSDLRLAELLAALSHALDMTEGQPEGHCIRCCYIGQRIGEALGLSEDEMWELYYVLLLKDLGCSSNAARICELYLTDDLNFKRDFKEIGTGLPSVLQFIMSHTGLKSDLAGRFRAVFNILQNGHDYSKELMQTRCSRGADIARKLRFSEAVAIGIHDLDEHFDGNGQPQRLVGEAISPYARIALMAQVVDVFFTSKGVEAAKKEVAERTGKWFDPAIANAFFSVAKDKSFWQTLSADNLDSVIFSLAPARREVIIDDDYLDDIAIAFGQVVDSKSPYTSGHSARVALFTDMIAEHMGLGLQQRRWLKRGALLHDLGKLGVSNSILDKPGKLDDEEWVQMRNHALFTTQILSHMACFATLAKVAGATTND